MPTISKRTSRPRYIVNKDEVMSADELAFFTGRRDVEGASRFWCHVHRERRKEVARLRALYEQNRDLVPPERAAYIEGYLRLWSA